MRKPEIDYRTFRLSKLNDPQFAHLKLLGGWIGYFIMYFLTENLIPAESCHVVHCWIDDLIPFCEWFLIPYVFWTTALNCISLKPLFLACTRQSETSCSPMCFPRQAESTA